MPLKERPDATWLPALLDEFLDICQGAVGGGDAGNKTPNRQAIQYCERFVEFIVDLLSQLPTRRFVRTVLDDRQVLIKARMVALHSHTSGRLYGQLAGAYTRPLSSSS